MQTEAPYWLEQAYSSAIARQDVSQHAEESGKLRFNMSCYSTFCIRKHPMRSTLGLVMASSSAADGGPWLQFFLVRSLRFQ